MPDPVTKRKLNIAMICDPIGDNKSGVVVSTIRFASLLKERGHNVIFIGAKFKEYPDVGFYEGIKTYRFRSFPIPKSGGWSLAFPTVHELRKVFADEKIDIVHIILPMSAALIAIKAAKQMGIKIVAHSHSQPENIFMDMPKIIQPTLNKIWNDYLIWIYSKAEFLIYPSRMASDLLEWLSKKGQSSAIISNGINIKKYFPHDPGDFYKRFNIPTDTIKILFVGRLFPEKSVETLINAVPFIIEKNPKIHIMLVGKGYLRPRLEKLVDKLGVDNYVSFLGLLSEEDKITAYNACDIFVLPSQAELEGMVVLEAMACGKPILIADAPMSASRYFVEDNGFLFKNKDPKDLAEQALKLITNNDLRLTMGRNSLEKSKKYDIDRSVEKLEEVYYSIL
jgi:glycosyltransferase involved in cell wall biosynthesis